MFLLFKHSYELLNLNLKVSLKRGYISPVRWGCLRASSRVFDYIEQESVVHIVCLSVGR